MTVKQLRMDYVKFTAFIDEQLQLYRTPGSPNKLVLSASDFKWLADWDAYDLSLSPMEDSDRILARVSHYRGWIGCERQYVF